MFTCAITFDDPKLHQHLRVYDNDWKKHFLHYEVRIERPDIRVWCFDNLKYLPVGTRNTLHFHNENDMMMFRLKWL